MVNTHMVNVLRKLDVETRLQALIFAVRHRLVQIE
jgi:DNA-binding NarL/FixJ family response regulator